MQLSLELALRWTERLTALAVALQSLELLRLRRSLADDGVWRWSILRDEHARLPLLLRALFAVLLPYRAFVVLLALRLPLAAALTVGVGEAAWPLVVSQLAISVRFRGTFNGGSDYMTMVLLLGLSVAALPVSGDTVEQAGLGYICVQLLLSYWIAGIVKLRQPAWRSGAALRAVLAGERFGVRPWVRRGINAPVALALSWAVIAFELGFPLSLLRVELASALIASGLLFHAVNALALGLNRFLFAWAAAYPALLYFSAALASR